jgi:hypothetical protein
LMLAGERARDRTRVTHQRKSDRGGPSGGEPYRTIRGPRQRGGWKEPTTWREGNEANALTDGCGGKSVEWMPS